MEQKSTSVQEISQILNKVQKHWEKVLENKESFSKIDKDILMNDLRKVYELISDINKIESSNEFAVKSPFSSSKILFEDEPVATIHHNEKSKLSNSGYYEDDSIDRDNKTENRNLMLDFEKERTEKTSFPTQTSGEKGTPTSEQNPVSYTQGTERVANQQKTMIDLFTPQKTVSDILQDNVANTVAAKIQNNHIDNIKTVIGINDKFTFINDIFKGEISKYNEAIDRLNSFKDFQEALNYIKSSGFETGTTENQIALEKLIKLLKRKFYE